MSRLVVYPYKMGSASGKLLAGALGALRVYADGNYSPRPDDVIVNWGNGNRPSWSFTNNTMMNHWNAICKAINKKASFANFKAAGVSTVPVTVEEDVARGWLNDGNMVVGRQRVEGARGEGIIMMKSIKDFEPCPLYTRYQKKIKEYRVYVFGDKVLDVLEKRRDTEKLAKGEVDEFIRTEENGWVFCRWTPEGNPLPFSEVAGEEAIKAIKSLGLLFGGVDVMWNDYENKAYVLEVNTAPGIYGATVTRYVDAIQTYAANL